MQQSVNKRYYDNKCYLQNKSDALNVIYRKGLYIIGNHIEEIFFKHQYSLLHYYIAVYIINDSNAHMHVYIYVCVCVCVYICVSVYIYDILIEE